MISRSFWLGLAKPMRPIFLFPVIDINRPKDGYGVVLTLVKADINAPISDDKFALEQPEGTTLQVLGAKPSTQPNALPAGDSSAPRKKTTH